MIETKPMNISDLPNNRKEGFADVARWIALDPDNETLIFRKFDELAARNLLYLQAELLVLEKQLFELDTKDADSDDMDLKDAIRTWETLTRQYQEQNETARVRVDLIVRTREKLKEYRESWYRMMCDDSPTGKADSRADEALLLQSEIAKMKRPAKRVLDTYRQWFTRPYPALGGKSKTFLEDHSDLVALKTSETDYLSLFLRRHWPANASPLLSFPSQSELDILANTSQEELSRDGLNRIGRFNEKSISITVAIVSILVAAFLLVGSITGLYFITNTAAKLGTIAAFTAAFALSVGLMTNASRAEIFAATAA
jgi:hypothetical protein